MNEKTIDTSNLNLLEERLNELTPEKRTTIIYNSLVKGGKLLVDVTKSELKKAMGPAATRPVRNKKKDGNAYPPLIDGIHISSKDKSYCEVNVTILRRNGGYLHWFEKGTAIRRTQSGANRGSINALNFFLAARQISFNDMNNTIIGSIDTQLRKILN